MEELPEKAGKEKVEVEAPEIDEALLEQIRASHGQTLDRGDATEDKLERQDAIDAVDDEVVAATRPGRPATTRPTWPSRRGHGGLRDAREGHDPQGDRRRQEAPRRSRPGRDPADRDRGRHRAARSRLGAVHPRRDADPLERRARHDADGHEGRQPRPPGDEALLAPLQLPAVLGRGGRLHARPEAPRHRPRRARRAGARADDPGRGRVPVRDPRRLRHARVERLLVDGLGLRLLDGPAGRGRPGQRHRSPASRWA